MGTIRSRTAAALVALATVAAGLVLVVGATPAHAGWTDAGTMNHFRVCKQAGTEGRGWVFLAQTRKRAGNPDARAGMAIFAGGERRQRWSSGWLRDRELGRGWVRTPRTHGVRLHVRQEAGDRDSGVGTALEYEVLRPAQIARCR